MTLFQLLKNRFDKFKSMYPLEYEELLLKMLPNHLLWHENETSGHIICNPFHIEFQNTLSIINGSSINIFQKNDHIRYMVIYYQQINKIVFKRVCNNWEGQIFRTKDAVKFFCKIAGYIPHRGGVELQPIKFKGIDNDNLSYLQNNVW